MSKSAKTFIVALLIVTTVVVNYIFMKQLGETGGVTSYYVPNFLSFLGLYYIVTFLLEISMFVGGIVFYPSTNYLNARRAALALGVVIYILAIAKLLTI